MELTKQQRNEIYRKMLGKMEQSSLLNNFGCFHLGLCRYLRSVNRGFPITSFPELMECKPKEKLVSDFWFPYNTSEHAFLRIWIVMDAIEKTN